MEPVKHAFDAARWDVDGSRKSTKQVTSPQWYANWSLVPVEGFSRRSVHSLAQSIF